MANRRKLHLDALERRLTGPKRIALFGHRNVGKTTLLAMFYRQASTGQVPGLRLAAADSASAEYLAEKIAQIEAGDPPAGTLAETELKLRLYRGSARLELIVKDYQGEHITLGSEEPIQAFFADCDAVLLCLDPEGSPTNAERRRRQQEVENLLERYIDRSDDATTGRPIALLLTKFDRVLAQNPAAVDEAPDWGVERLVDERYGMTRHVLAQHAPGAAIFAVSAYGPGGQDGRPPAELCPLGLDRPLDWLVDQLEASDRAQLEWLWDLAPLERGRLKRCVAAYERRYPRSEHLAVFRDRLRALTWKRRRRFALSAASAVVGVAAALAGYDAWGYRNAVAFEREGRPPAAIADGWSKALAWHPTLSFFWPARAREGRIRRDQWLVKAAELKVALGTAEPDLRDQLTRLKDQAPNLAPAIKQVEQAQDRARHEARWTEARADALADPDQPEKPLAALRAFLREFPDTEHRQEALALVDTLKTRLAAQRSATERRIVDDLARAEAIPGSDPRDLIDRAQQFLSEHPQSDWRPEVERRLDGYIRQLDERDIDRARTYSRQYPANFAIRIERYQDYLRGHQGGGRYISEATEAKDRILREWDEFTYRLAYDHFSQHPDDLGEVARRLRDYLREHPDGHHTRDAQQYLAWWEKVSVPHGYRVTLRRGEVEPTVGKYLAGGGPDLGVEIDVGGVTYGPSPIVRNSRKPIWDYTFSRPIQWKLGEPVTVRIIDHDWSDSTVYTLYSRKGDPLAIRLISGSVGSSKGGKTNLVFASDFEMPTLRPPEQP
jgi:GTPase SAR1 family protein